MAVIRRRGGVLIDDPRDPSVAARRREDAKERQRRLDQRSLVNRQFLEARQTQERQTAAATAQRTSRQQFATSERRGAASDTAVAKIIESGVPDGKGGRRAPTSAEIAAIRSALGGGAPAGVPGRVTRHAPPSRQELSRRQRTFERSVDIRGERRAAQTRTGVRKMPIQNWAWSVPTSAVQDIAQRFGVTTLPVDRRFDTNAEGLARRALEVANRQGVSVQAFQRDQAAISSQEQQLVNNIRSLRPADVQVQAERNPELDAKLRLLEVQEAKLIIKSGQAGQQQGVSPATTAAIGAQGADLQQQQQLNQASQGILATNVQAARDRPLGGVSEQEIEDALVQGFEQPVAAGQQYVTPAPPAADVVPPIEGQALAPPTAPVTPPATERQFTPEELQNTAWERQAYRNINPITLPVLGPTGERGPVGLPGSFTGDPGALLDTVLPVMNAVTDRVGRIAAVAPTTQPSAQPSAQPAVQEAIPQRTTRLSPLTQARQEIGGFYGPSPGGVAGGGGIPLMAVGAEQQANIDIARANALAVRQTTKDVGLDIQVKEKALAAEASDKRILPTTGSISAGLAASLAEWDAATFHSSTKDVQDAMDAGNAVLAAINALPSQADREAVYDFYNRRDPDKWLSKISKQASTIASASILTANVKEHSAAVLRIMNILSGRDRTGTSSNAATPQSGGSPLLSDRLKAGLKGLQTGL